MTDHARRPISKKTRFEVFKRDSFKCQYCGQSAPEVILHVDHIKPVAGGGESDILNLVTSCAGCNGGKAATPLDDSTAIRKAHHQAALLQERREQIAMMAEWHTSLAGVNEEATSAAVQHFEGIIHGYHLNDPCRLEIAKLIRKFGLSLVLGAMTTSGDHYLEIGPEGKLTQDSVNMAYRKIGGICSVSQRSDEDPFLRDTYYIRAIVRRRLDGRWYLGWEAFKMIHEALEGGIPFTTLKAAASDIVTWNEFRDRVEELTGAANG